MEGTPPCADLAPRVRQHVPLGFVQHQNVALQCSLKKAICKLQAHRSFSPGCGGEAGVGLPYPLQFPAAQWEDGPGVGSSAHLHTVQTSIACTQGSEWHRPSPAPRTPNGTGSNCCCSPFQSSQLAVETGSGVAWSKQGAWRRGGQGRPSRELCLSWQVDTGRQRQGAGSLLGLEVEQGAGGQEGPSKSTQEFGLLLKLLKMSVEGRRGIVTRVFGKSPPSGRGKMEGGS